MRNVNWQESYDLSQRPELLYNVGLALQKLGRIAPAIEAFEGHLAWGKGERGDEVRGRIAALRDLAARPAPHAKPVPTPAAVAVAAAVSETRPAHAPGPAARVERRSSRGWWIAAGVVLAAAAIAVGVAVPLSQRDTKPENVPEPNTGLTINALRLAP